jgi:hypothetical protein
MAELALTPPTLTVRLTRGEKIAGLLRDTEVPLTAVRQVEVVHDPLTAVRGMRAPGMALPGIRKVGTWRRAGERALVSVQKGQPAVRIRLTGQRIDELLIGADDAEARAAELRAVLPPAG